MKTVATVGYRQVEPYGFPDGGALEMIKAARDNLLGSFSFSGRERKD
jgi:hypothetical protein